MDAVGAALWSGLNSGVALSVIAVVWTMLWQNVHHFPLWPLLRRQLNRRARRLAAMADPYLSLRIDEFEGGRMKCSPAYEEVKAYLSAASAGTDDVRHLKAECTKDSDKLVLSMVDGEEVPDEFAGATVWWSARSLSPASDFPLWRRSQVERRYYFLYFHGRHRDLVINTYLPHVRRQGRAVMVQNRQLKLFSNITREGWSWDEDGHYKKSWTHVPFEHPKTFDTLAMDPEKKKEIIADLDTFKNGKEYYKRVGKAWKRGYLLHGPPGTGKSTMIAAMANYLEYDVYDVELTTVKTNTDLRKLLIETSNKSIMVFEDIDCSLDLTGKRERKKKKKEKKDEDEDEDGLPKRPDQDDAGSRVTLSGLLNFIDGLWSACGEERLIVLTTNHVEKLDPALIRTGRMDKHIKMSYCDFESFKFLAKTHLGDVDMEAHEASISAVRELLQEVNMVPADVGEHLTPKAMGDPDAAGSCLANLVEALQKAKEEAIQKAKEEALQKAKEEELEKDKEEAPQKAKAQAANGGKGQEDEQVAEK